MGTCVREDVAAGGSWSPSLALLAPLFPAPPALPPGRTCEELLIPLSDGTRLHGWAPRAERRRQAPDPLDDDPVHEHGLPRGHRVRDGHEGDVRQVHRRGDQLPRHRRVGGRAGRMGARRPQGRAGGRDWLADRPMPTASCLPAPRPREPGSPSPSTTLRSGRRSGSRPAPTATRAACGPGASSRAAR